MDPLQGQYGGALLGQDVADVVGPSFEFEGG